MKGRCLHTNAWNFVVCSPIVIHPCLDLSFYSFNPFRTNGKLTCRAFSSALAQWQVNLPKHMLVFCTVIKLLFAAIYWSKGSHLIVCWSLFHLISNTIGGIIEKISVNCCRVTSDRQTHSTQCVSLWRKVCVTGLAFRIRLGLKYLFSCHILPK